MRWGCLKSWLLFRHPRELKIKSLYIKDLIFNIASTSKETVKKLKFLDSPVEGDVLCAQNISAVWNYCHPWQFWSNSFTFSSRGKKRPDAFTMAIVESSIE